MGTVELPRMRLGRIFRREEVTACLRKAKVLQQAIQVTSLDWSRDGRILMWRTGDGKLFGLDAESGRELPPITQYRNSGETVSVRFTPHPAAVVFGAWHESRKHGALTYDIAHRTPIAVYTESQTEGFRVTQVAVDRSNDLFSTSYENGMVALWDFRSSRAVGIFVGLDKANVDGNAACFEQRGYRFCITQGSDTVALYDLRTHQPITMINTPSEVEGSSIQDIAFSPQGQTIGVKMTDGTTSVVTLSDTGSPGDGKVEYTYTEYESDLHEGVTQGNGLAWTPTGILTTGHDDGSITYWHDANTPRVIGEGAAPCTARHPSCVGPVMWCPTRPILASACHLLYLWVPEEEGARAEAETEAEAEPTQDNAEQAQDSEVIDLDDD